MSNRNFTLLTGATGQIGRYLLRDMLARGMNVAVLARGRNGVSARQRIEAIVAGWRASSPVPLADPVVLAGDTTREEFGLDFQSRQFVSDQCGTLFHNAASVDFNGGGTGATWENNVSSARRVLEVCASGKIDHLAYVSTAYVCGERTDAVFEHQLAEGQSFRNEYEHSKFEAERIVRDSGAVACSTVLRPAIVVGDHATGQTNAYHSFYRLPQFTQMIAKAADKDSEGRWRHNVRINLTGNEERNFVTVDWVSAAMVEILDQPAAHGKTFHLTPSEPTTSREIEVALQRYFHYDGVTFAGDRPVDPATGSPEEQRFYDYIGDYKEYWAVDPTFVRENTDAHTTAVPHDRVDVDCLVRLIDYAVKTRFGRGERVRTKKRKPTQALHAGPEPV